MDHPTGSGARHQWAGIEILDLPHPEIAYGVFCGEPYTKLRLPGRDITDADWRTIKVWLKIRP